MCTGGEVSSLGVEYRLGFNFLALHAKLTEKRVAHWKVCAIVVGCAQESGSKRKQRSGTESEKAVFDSV